MSELIVIASCNSVPEAQILRGVLENAGIPAMLRNEHLVNAQWLYAGAVGGVEVGVPEAFAEDAVRVLRGEVPLSAEEATHELPEDDDAATSAAISEQAPRSEGSPPLPEDVPECPVCGGQGVPRKLKGLFAALTFILCIPLPGARAHWSCKECGKTF